MRSRIFRTDFSFEFLNPKPDQTGIEYERDARYAGKTNFSFFGATALALDGFVSFSLIPLRFILITGIIISFLSFLFFLFLFSVKILNILDIYQLTSLQLPTGLTLTNSILTLSLGLVTVSYTHLTLPTNREV